MLNNIHPGRFVEYRLLGCAKCLWGVYLVGVRYYFGASETVRFHAFHEYMNYGPENFDTSIQWINVYEGLRSVDHNTKSVPDFLFSILFQKRHNTLARPVYFLFRTEINIFCGLVWRSAYTQLRKRSECT